MFNFNKKKYSSESTLKPLSVIGIKSDKDRNLPMLVFTIIATLIAMYCIVRVEFESFQIMTQAPAGPYWIRFDDEEARQLYLKIFLGCAAVCVASALGKHSLKATITLFAFYIIHFGFHYKYVANGFVHILNKAVFSILLEQGRSSDIYYLTYFEVGNAKTELTYFIFAVIFGTCFFMAYAGINKCSPVFFTVIVSIYAAVPFICNTFDGEKYLVCAGMICILNFMSHFEGYSNFASKKIFSDFGNVIKIRGQYVSFAAFQQSVMYMAAALVILAVSNFACNFSEYQRIESIDNFARKVIYTIQSMTENNSFGNFGDSSGAFNNGDLKSLGNLYYTGKIMFDIKIEPEENEVPLYLRSYTASEYTGAKWEEISRKEYRKYKFWDNYAKSDFYPQFCYGTASELSGRELEYNDVLIINRNMNPKVFLTDYRMSSKESSVIENASASFDNTFRFDGFGGSENYKERLANPINFSENDILAVTKSMDGSLYQLLHDGDFEIRSLPNSENKNAQELTDFLEQEKKYRAFVMENYLDYPENMDNYLPADFDTVTEDLYNSFLYKDLFSDVYEYTESGEQKYNSHVAGDYYSKTASYIKEYLQGSAEYSLTPGATPRDRDFVDYFLKENKEGYCVHFATAATLMLRRAGIPARYVEGYFVGKYNLQKKNSSGYSPIPDSNAHAWTEVYYPLLGWQVIDFTPHYSDAELPDENKMDSDSDTDTETETDTDNETDTETETDSETTTDTETETDSSIESDTDSEDAVLSSSDVEQPTNPQKNNRLKEFFKRAGAVILKILKILLIIALIVGLWFAMRFAVRKIRHKLFYSDNRRKGARAIYIYCLFALKIAGVVPNKGEGEKKFAMRAMKLIDGIKTSEFEAFTDNALKARFGKDAPSETEINEMIRFVEKLIASIYDESGRCKKLIIKYLLFMN